MKFPGSWKDWLKKRPTIRPEDYVGSDPLKNEQIVREGFLPKAKRFLRGVPMAEEIVALYHAMLDPKTPAWVKGVAAAALAYFILPLDAVPDVLPIIGLSDDLSVLSAALAAVSMHITEEHRERARAWLADEQLIDVPPATGQPEAGPA